MIRLDLKNSSPVFRLFTRFAVAGLIGFLVISLLLFYLWTRTFERRLIAETKETRARYTNALIGHMLTRDDFANVKKGTEWETFRQKISDLFSIPEVVRVKIYNPEGILIWSDSVKLMELAPQAQKNPQLISALAGHVEANISALEKEEHRFERGAFRRLMELYVPVYFTQGEPPAGVVEVYLNVDPLFATIGDTSRLIGLTVVGGLGLLLAVSFTGLGRAVVVIHKQNQELRDRLEEIFKATRMKNEIFAELSHEVRNPHAVMSYANLLWHGAFGNLPEKTRKAKPPLDKLRNTAAEVLSHFARIVELSRLKVGDVQPQREPVELIELLRGVANDLRLLSGNGAVKLSLAVPSEPVIINSDQRLLQQVVFNLVTNALKFTPSGEIAVCLERDLALGRVMIVVEDTGIGIKPEELPRIFEDFYRGNHLDARFNSGVGLGLAIVKRSLDLLEGEIQVESTYGKGSKFTVTLQESFKRAA